MKIITIGTQRIIYLYNLNQIGFQSNLFTIFKKERKFLKL